MFKKYIIKLIKECVIEGFSKPAVSQSIKENRLNHQQKLIDNLKKQIECGIGHETEPKIEQPDIIYIQDSAYLNYVPQNEICKNCGKILKVFNSSIEVDFRKAELLEIEAKKIKENCIILEQDEYNKKNNIMQL